MKKNQLAPDCIDDLFASARNAGDKGLAQYFTPFVVGQALAAVLPSYRPVIVDLHCSQGDLLHAASNRTTGHLLGCDITARPRRAAKDEATAPRLDLTFTQADVTRLYPFLRNVRFPIDCAVLNPPWRLEQYREPLRDLSTSTLPAVRNAFLARERSLPEEAIDSFIAGVLIALDRFGEYGEGFAIGNSATIQRLIFAPDAPHRALLRHIWLLVELGDCFHTGCPAAAIYFARAEQATPVRTTLERLPQSSHLRNHRRGIDAGENFCSTLEETLPRWKAAAEGYRIATKPRASDWNIWLERDGTLRTQLSIYDQQNVEVNKSDAEALHQLNGQHPLQLVLQRPTRKILERYAGPDSIWRVEPAVLTATAEAVASYHRGRAPLWPLNPVMRLGWLDDQDRVTCIKDLVHERRPVFRAGEQYELSARTVCVTRRSEKRNLRGGLDEVHLSGRELCFEIMDATGRKRAFRIVRENELADPNDKQAPAEVWPLEKLLEHFEIPDVPDVARAHPDRYQFYRDRLQQLEQATQRTAAAV